MLSPVDLRHTIHRIPWFVDLTPDQIEQLARIASLHCVEKGDLLYREGDREDLLYVLLEGQVQLELEVPTRGQTAFYIAESLDIIGWSSLTPVVRQRENSARAAQASTLVGFNSKLLLQLCDEDPRMGYIIMRRLSNVVANRLLTMRLCLLDMIANPQAVH